MSPLRGVVRRARRGGRRQGRWHCWGLTFALASTDGGMTLSGPNDCLGSMNDARILPHFLHSAAFQGCVSMGSLIHETLEEE